MHVCRRVVGAATGIQLGRWRCLRTITVSLTGCCCCPQRTSFHCIVPLKTLCAIWHSCSTNHLQRRQQQKRRRRRRTHQLAQRQRRGELSAAWFCLDRQALSQIMPLVVVTHGLRVANVCPTANLVPGVIGITATATATATRPPGRCTSRVNGTRSPLGATNERSHRDDLPSRWAGNQRHGARASYDNGCHHGFHTCK